jgi:hypothetical protein
MSLVGSLEDLGLADILQIVSLARKSGRLLLRTDGESGRIIVRDGMVQGAVIKGDAADLRRLVVGGGEMSAEAFERTRELASLREIPVEEALVQTRALARDRLDALRRAHVERAVMRMFSWRTGEFSFEVREDTDPEDTGLLLPTGINTQYLAMEATRLRDEGTLLGDPMGVESDDDAPLFSGEEGLDPLAESSPVEVVALASARDADDDEDDPDDATLSGIAVPAAPLPVQESPAPPVEVRVEVEADPVLPPLVAIDRDLAGLEWLKLSAGESFSRVHIFQHGEAGMDRIRRYLARGVIPLVALSPELVATDGQGRRLLDRLRSLSSDMAVLALLAGEARAPDGFDGAVIRPAALGDPEHWPAHAERSDALRGDLHEAVRRARAAAGSARGGPSSALASLRTISDRLRDPGRRDDVLSLVLEFAARDLARVAVFMLRDDVAVGMAQRGVSAAGGPDDAALRAIEIEREAFPELFERALSERRGVRGPLGRSGARGLARLLAGREPREAYVAPIESADCVAALVYADNQPSGAPIPDTTALEIVLHEAGLALDRAALERALAKARG